MAPVTTWVYAIISELIPNEKITFLHQGEVKNHVEQGLNEEWANSEEGYVLKEDNGITILNVNLTLDEKWQDFFNDTFPKAIALVKEDAENGTVKLITVQTVIDKPLQEVWDKYTKPEHIVNWNFASDDWHCPAAENNLQVGGTFNYTMASKDEPIAFDFEGTYEAIETHKKIVYKIADGRKVVVKFDVLDDKVILTEIFEPENVHSIALQRDGWQAILDNFKKHIN